MAANPGSPGYAGSSFCAAGKWEERYLAHRLVRPCSLSTVGPGRSQKTRLIRQLTHSGTLWHHGQTHVGVWKPGIGSTQFVAGG